MAWLPRTSRGKIRGFAERFRPGSRSPSPSPIEESRLSRQDSGTSSRAWGSGAPSWRRRVHASRRCLERPRGGIQGFDSRRQRHSAFDGDRPKARIKETRWLCRRLRDNRRSATARPPTSTMIAANRSRSAAAPPPGTSRARPKSPSPGAVDHSPEAHLPLDPLPRRDALLACHAADLLEKSPTTVNSCIRPVVVLLQGGYGQGARVRWRVLGGTRGVEGVAVARAMKVRFFSDLERAALDLGPVAAI